MDWDASAAEKGGYPYFMLKEITEQPQALADTLRGRLSPAGQIELDELRLDPQELRDVDKVFIVACGTAYHAGMIAKYAIEHWTRLPCEVELASEFRYRDPVLDRGTLVIAISQSGETLDTLMAVKHAREQNARVLAVCNSVGSTIPRESDAVLYTHCGPEVGVAATKTFLGQVAACLLVGPLPRAGARCGLGRRGHQPGRAAAADARAGRADAAAPSSRCGHSPASWSMPRRCSSSAATSATRWRWRVR